MPTALSKIMYTAVATAKGGRAGHVTSEDGVLDLDLAAPDPQNPKANPESLFAAGYSACFQGALENRAKTKNVDTSESTVTAKVSLGGTGDGGVGLAVELVVHIPGIDIEQARELVELAHQFCPYSRATRDNIEVMLTVQ